MQRPSKQEVKAAVGIVMAIADCIREAKEVPSGELYAMLMGKVSLERYEQVITFLKNSGLISESNHLLRWTGPANPQWEFGVQQ